MPNKKAAFKDVKQNAKRKLANDSVLHELKDILRKIRKSIESEASKTDLNKLYQEAQKIIDKASKNNILKKNAASRKKAHLPLLLLRLKKNLNKISNKLSFKEGLFLM